MQICMLIWVLPFANSLLLSHSEKTMKSYSEIPKVRKTYNYAGSCSLPSFEIDWFPGEAHNENSSPFFYSEPD